MTDEGHEIMGPMITVGFRFSLDIAYVNCVFTWDGCVIISQLSICCSHNNKNLQRKTIGTDPDPDPQLFSADSFFLTFVYIAIFVGLAELNTMHKMTVSCLHFYFWLYLSS